MPISYISMFVLIGGIIFFMYRHKKRFEAANNKSKIDSNQNLPDLPINFGYKLMWFTIKTDNHQRLINIFNLRNPQESNWKNGLDAAYKKNSIFITPAIEGWTIVCGWGLPKGDSVESIMAVKKLLENLSKEFEEAQFYCTHRITEYHCWMKAINGKVIRIYSFSGESGDNLYIEGDETPVEQNLNLINTFSLDSKDEKYFDREDIGLPDEEMIMMIAANWSIAPTQLEEKMELSTGIGIVGN